MTDLDELVRSEVARTTAQLESARRLDELVEMEARYMSAQRVTARLLGVAARNLDMLREHERTAKLANRNEIAETLRYVISQYEK